MQKKVTQPRYFTFKQDIMFGVSLGIIIVIVLTFVPGSFSLASQFGEIFPLLVLVSIPGIVLAILLGVVLGTLGGLIGKYFASPSTRFPC